MKCDLDDDTNKDHDPESPLQGSPTGLGENLLVVVTPDAGVGIFEPLRIRNSPRSPHREIPLDQTIKAGLRNSRSALKKHAVSCQLAACLTLTYAAIPDDPEGDLDIFIDEVRSLYPEQLHWASVTEDGENNNHRPHHHVMLPLCEDLYKVACRWPYGDVHVGINLTDESIRRAVNYLAHHFPSASRGRRRFRRSRGKKIATQRHIVGSPQEARELIESYMPEHVREYQTYDPRCGGRTITYWEVHTYPGVV